MPYSTHHASLPSPPWLLAWSWFNCNCSPSMFFFDFRYALQEPGMSVCPRRSTVQELWIHVTKKTKTPYLHLSLIRSWGRTGGAKAHAALGTFVSAVYCKAKISLLKMSKQKYHSYAFSTILRFQQDTERPDLYINFFGTGPSIISCQTCVSSCFLHHGIRDPSCIQDYTSSLNTILRPWSTPATHPSPVRSSRAWLNPLNIEHHWTLESAKSFLRHVQAFCHVDVILVFDAKHCSQGLWKRICPDQSRCQLHLQPRPHNTSKPSSSPDVPIFLRRKKIHNNSPTQDMYSFVTKQPAAFLCAHSQHFCQYPGTGSPYYSGSCSAEKPWLRKSLGPRPAVCARTCKRSLGTPTFG